MSCDTFTPQTYSLPPPPSSLPFPPCTPVSKIFKKDAAPAADVTRLCLIGAPVFNRLEPPEFSRRFRGSFDRFSVEFRMYFQLRKERHVYSNGNLYNPKLRRSDMRKDRNLVSGPNTAADMPLLWSLRCYKHGAPNGAFWTIPPSTEIAKNPAFLRQCLLTSRKGKNSLEAMEKLHLQFFNLMYYQVAETFPRCDC
jgi:hypothetical protein